MPNDGSHKRGQDSWLNPDSQSDWVAVDTEKPPNLSGSMYEIIMRAIADIKAKGGVFPTQGQAVIHKQVAANAIADQIIESSSDEHMLGFAEWLRKNYDRF